MCRRAFTTLELIITMSIISALVGITLPAIQKAQVCARRTSCGTQLRALALGIISYAQNSTANLPPGPRELPAGGKFAADPDRGSPLELFNEERIGRTDFSSQNGWYAQGLLWQQGAVDQPRFFFCPEMERRGWGFANAWPRRLSDAPDRAGEKPVVTGSYIYRGGYSSAVGTPDGPLSLYRDAPGEPLFADSPLFGTMVHPGGYSVAYLSGQVDFRLFAQPVVQGTYLTPLWTAVSLTAAHP